MKQFTNRGLESFVEFKDHYQADIKVRESSSDPLGPKVWVFVTGGAVTGNNGSILLDVERAQKLIDGLQAFIAKQKKERGT